jgi:hypothetical protein
MATVAEQFLRVPRGLVFPCAPNDFHAGIDFKARQFPDTVRRSRLSQLRKAAGHKDRTLASDFLKARHSILTRNVAFNP